MIAAVNWRNINKIQIELNHKVNKADLESSLDGLLLLCTWRRNPHQS